MQTIHHDTKAWKLQVWVSLATAATLCATGLAWLPGQDLDRAFMVMGYLFTMSTAFALAKYVRDNEGRCVDTACVATCSNSRIHWRNLMKKLILAAALSLALSLAVSNTVRAHSGASEMSALSMLPVAFSVAAPIGLLSAGAVFTVVAVEAASAGTVWVLERASDGARQRHAQRGGGGWCLGAGRHGGGGHRLQRGLGLVGSGQGDCLHPQ